MPFSSSCRSNFLAVACDIFFNLSVDENFIMFSYACQHCDQGFCDVSDWPFLWMRRVFASSCVLLVVYTSKPRLQFYLGFVAGLSLCQPCIRKSFPHNGGHKAIKSVQRMSTNVSVIKPERKLV